MSVVGLSKTDFDDVALSAPCDNEIRAAFSGLVFQNTFTREIEGNGVLKQGGEFNDFKLGQERRPE